jgi:hypothetical protein
MSTETWDFADTLAPKSDQLNADDLIAGPITVKLVGFKRLPSVEQPVQFAIEGRRPWRPCKGMRRLLASAWGGTDPAPWMGRSVTLFRDPDATFGGEVTGGIRVSALSDITQTLKVAVTISRGKKKIYTVTPLKVAPPTPAEITVKTLQNWCQDAVKSRGWTQDRVKALLGGPAANTPPEMRAEMIERLKGPPPVVETDDDFGGPDEEEQARILAEEREQAAK